MLVRPSTLATITLLSGFLVACRSQPPAEMTPAVTPFVTEASPPAVAPVEVTRVVEQAVAVTAGPTPTATPEPPKELTVCMTHEPESLYRYGDPLFGAAEIATQAVQHAVYESLYTTLSYSYQAQGLVKLPTLEDGDAELQRVTAVAGDRVVSAAGHVARLVEGLRVFDAVGQEVAFDGRTPVEMTQMVVRFQLRPMAWSDGVPVTAADSVYSFSLAADADTPGNKQAIERTAAYVALDDWTTEWRGLPGWRDPTYFTNVWSPLPRHQLGGRTAIELLTAAETTRQPLSNGPFVIAEWVAGDHIRLERNPYYYRAAEGLPRLDRLFFRFLPNAEQVVAQLLAGACQVATQDGLGLAQAPLLWEGQQDGLVSPAFASGLVFEHLDFNIAPVEEYAATRPAWFADERVRQAFALCLNRQAIVEAVTYGLAPVLDVYLPPEHPLYPADLTTWPYDPARANELLEAAGYRDNNGDGLRADPATNAPFQVWLGVNQDSPLRQQVAEMVRQDLRACGIEVEVRALPAEEWFDPRGPLFGRRFDLALFPWLIGSSPDCGLYLTSAIPSPANGWEGNNETGWSNAEYDAACQAALAAPVGSAEYAAQHRAALRLFADNLPVIPLFLHVKVAAVTAVRHFHLDPTQPSELYNVYEWDLEEE
ncbi:MAG: peptide ABC transporter substrate-binding protein [Chloroflexota bacterium]